MVVAYLKAILQNSPGDGETTEGVSEDSEQPGRNSKPGPSGQERGVLPLQLLARPEGTM
jgi:hypothetical protein